MAANPNTWNSPSSEYTTVRVSNVPYNAQANDVVALFQRHLPSDVVRCEIVTKKEGSSTAKSTGRAWVTFKTRRAADRAISLAGSRLLQLRGRTLRVEASQRHAVREAKHEPVTIPTTTVRVGSLLREDAFEVEWSVHDQGAEMCFDFESHKLLLRLPARATWINDGSAKLSSFLRSIRLFGRDGLQAPEGGGGGGGGGGGSEHAGKTKYMQELKLEFRFGDLIRVDRIAKEDRSAALVPMVMFECWIPPSVYVHLERAKGGQDGEWEEEEDMELSPFVWCSDPLMYNDRNKSLDEDVKWTRTVDLTSNGSIGRCLVYQVIFPATLEARRLLGTALQRLQDFLPAKDHASGREVTVSVARNAMTGFREPGDATAPSGIVTTLPTPPEIPYEIMFAVNRLVHNDIVCAQNLSHEFYRLLHPSTTPKARALAALLSMYGAGQGEERIYDPTAWLRTELELLSTIRFLSEEDPNPVGQQLMNIRRLMVTPTKIYCEGPELEVSNRVTRRFPGKLSHFLRVTFCDESFQRISAWDLQSQLPDPDFMSMFSFSKSLSPSPVHDRIRKFLRNGVEIGGRKFEFLAFSASQLREQSVWFFAPDGETTPDSFRRWMGDFSNFRNTAKCAARMGQCFSSTTKTLPVLNHELRTIPDVTTRAFDGVEYCFSDGIGIISQEFAREVAAHVGIAKPHRQNQMCPSAFQIRYGGCKGVVAVDPSARHKLSLRPSMMKFQSEHRDLEVIAWSKFQPCFLNRQIITLLSTLRVPDEAFTRLQERMVSRLNAMLDDPLAAEAALRTMSAGDTHHLIVRMLRSGFHPKTEPHLQVMLAAFRAAHLLEIQQKARIFVRKGRCMIGCLDETGTLEYGQVFVKLTCTAYDVDLADSMCRDYLQNGRELGRYGTMQGVHAVLKGVVAVAKNPCLHPGDVRVLKAVDVPALHHMIDCVVFPRKGPRPHPNECSGSDLDGDVYTVIWDDHLIPPSRTSALPMDYVAAPAEELSRPVTMEDLQVFFVNHMLSDNLGIISNAHVAHADSSPLKTHDPKCIELAKLFSVAVDYPKTGVPAVMPRTLRPTEYPDFMEKGGKKTTYTSRNVLGILYRSAKVGHSEVTPAALRLHREDIERLYDKDLEYGDFSLLLGEAWECKRAYNIRLVGLMNQYRITSEAELVTGHVLKFSRFYQRKQQEVKDRVRTAYSAIRKAARQWFEQGYNLVGNPADASSAEDASLGHGGESNLDSIELEGEEEDYDYDTGEEELGRPSGGRNLTDDLTRASAWYHVTYHPDWIDRGKKEGYKGIPLLSFAWVAAKELGLLKTGLHSSVRRRI
ncbi:hypothetical protein CBR_g45545 [Chara braunii]|uniref:RNA-dependent RNA polymerase n=1 Tax=Chara braunii TaxID=69332 RepID=A0A388LYV7_CHABU|nr:hypothetical protein CBR_g45545 [Chara braunii]|eukprot:GBG87486.1 hypothetical protein CBR_g45545 [Chara braunii]